MSSYHSYDDFGVASQIPLPDTSILEGFSGSQVVAWHGAIERQIQAMISRYESSHNYDYVNKLRVFQNKWRSYQITGSINRETIDPLEAAADVLGVDSWRPAGFFSNLRDQLRKLVASEEQLPRGMSGPRGGGGNPPPGMGGGPPGSDFGAEEEPPGGPGGAGQAGGAPGEAGPGGPPIEPGAGGPGGPPPPGEGAPPNPDEDEDELNRPPA